MTKEFKDMNIDERIEYLKTLTDTEKLELMMEWGSWAEPSKERAVSHYVMLCQELPELYMAMTDNGMSYDSYSPKREVLPVLKKHNMLRSDIAMILDDYEKVFTNKDELLTELLKWLHKETDKFL